MADKVPCTVTEESPLATISDCSAKKQDGRVLEWGVRIEFLGDA